MTLGVTTVAVRDESVGLEKPLDEIDGIERRPAGGVAEVEHEPAAGRRGQRGRELLTGVPADAMNPEIPHAVAEVPYTHGRPVEALARERQVSRLGPPLSRDGDRHRRAGRAAQTGDRIGTPHGLRVDAVD